MSPHGCATLSDENALRRAIFEGDNETLANLLQCYTREDVAVEFADSFSELLSLAIHVTNDGAVKLLLQFGVNPNQRIVNGCKIVPLINAVKCGRMFSIYERDSTLIAPAVTEIIRLLLEYGANPLPRDDKSDDVQVCGKSCSKCAYIFNEISLINHHECERLQMNPLYYLHHLAVNSPQAAELLLKAVPGERGAYEATCDCEATRQTPLSVLLIRASRNYGCISDISAIFYYAILPLLRNGARLSLHQLISNPTLLAAVARMNAIRSWPLWRRPNAVADILIEANGENYSHLNWRQLLKAISNYEALFGDNNGDWVRYGYSEPLKLLADHFKTQWPRPLQAMCRAVILNRLPKGDTRRADAIASLQLPSSLTDYLTFTEFNLLIYNQNQLLLQLDG